MEITELTPDDTPRLMPLLLDLHGLHVTHQPERYPVITDKTALEDWFRGFIASETTTTLGALSPQGALMGYLVYDLEDRPAVPIRTPERRAMLHQIAVAPAFRRLGVGRALANRMRTDALAAGANVIATTYAPFNKASEGLMRSLGLCPVNIMAEWRPEAVRAAS